MGKKDNITEEVLDKKLKRLENNIIKKLNIIASAFDKPILLHTEQIERLERHTGLPPYAGEN